jgi:hypothetical protein
MFFLQATSARQARSAHPRAGVMEPRAAVRFAERFAPLRGMLYFCMLGFVLGASQAGPVDRDR